MANNFTFVFNISPEGVSTGDDISEFTIDEHGRLVDLGDGAAFPDDDGNDDFDDADVDGMEHRPGTAPEARARRTRQRKPRPQYGFVHFGAKK